MARPPARPAEIVPHPTALYRTTTALHHSSEACSLQPAACGLHALELHRSYVFPPSIRGCGPTSSTASGHLAAIEGCHLNSISTRSQASAFRATPLRIEA